MKKIITSVLALCALAVPCGAAEHKAVQNTTSNNIFIEGKIDNYEGGTITLRLYNGDNTCYISEIEPAENGEYVSKFKFLENAEELSYDLKLNGVDVNDTVISAYQDAASYISADVFLTDGEGGGLRINGDTQRMIYKDTDTALDGSGEKYTYELTTLEDYISEDTEVGVCIYPKNELGNDATGYTVVIAQYGDGGKLIECKVLKTDAMSYYDYEGNMIDCGKTALADGVKTVKAFIWDSNKNMVPYEQAADGALEKTNVYMIGSSGSAQWNVDYVSSFPMAGIGTVLKDYFNSDYVSFKNRAVSGATAQSFIDNDTNGGDWNAVKANLKAGDYVIIMLGANDFSLGYGDAEKQSHKEAMEVMVKDSINAGATPILVQTYIYAWEDSYLDFYGPSVASLEVLTDLGEEYGVEVLPLGDETVKIFKERNWKAIDIADNYHLTFKGVKNIIGEENFNKYYSKNSAEDKGHLNVYGADFYASQIAELLKKTDCQLRFYLK